MDFNERRRLVARRFDERRAVILEGAFVGNGLFAAMVCRYDQRPNILRFEMRRRDACDHSNRAAHRSLERQNYRTDLVSRGEVVPNAAMRQAESDGAILASAIAGPVLSQHA